MTFKNGIHLESEFAEYQKKARDLDKIKELVHANIQMKSKIKSNAQEVSKILGVTEKYKE